MSFLMGLSERVEAGARKALPYGLLAALFFLSTISVPYITTDLKAPFFLMGLYYWSIYRPTLIPPWMAFAAGIICDFITGMPLGLNACIFVLAQWLVSDQRRFLMGQSFIMLWFGFLLLSLLTGLMQWMILGLVGAAWPSLTPLWFSIGLGFALFPVVCIILHWTHKALPVPSRRLEPR
jgi:rod shape-determining protein MreD